MGGWLAAGTFFFPVGDFTGLNFLFLHCFWQAGQQCSTLLPLRLNVELTLCLPETDWTHQRGFSRLAQQVMRASDWLVLGVTIQTRWTFKLFWLSLTPNFFFFFGVGRAWSISYAHLDMWNHFNRYGKHSVCHALKTFRDKVQSRGPCISPTIPHVFSINRAPRGALNLRRVAAGGFMIINS